MTLHELIDEYVSSHPYGVSCSWAAQLRWAVSAWSSFVGHPLTVDYLERVYLNSYIDWLRANRAPDTARSRRGAILALWRYAYEEGIVEHGPRKIRKLRPITRCPEAWTLDEVILLCDAARSLRRKWRGVTWSQALWTESLFRAGYDSGLRLGDLLRLKASQVGPQFRVIQHKTGVPNIVGLHPATLALIDQCTYDHKQKLAWPQWASRDAVYRHIRKVVHMAPIREGTFRWLRRTAITQAEIANPGSGTTLAGHKHRSTTELWYIDRTQTDEAVLPPALS